jgi:hypothetical protein
MAPLVHRVPTGPARGEQGEIMSEAIYYDPKDAYGESVFFPEEVGRLFRVPDTAPGFRLGFASEFILLRDKRIIRHDTELEPQNAEFEHWREVSRAEFRAGMNWTKAGFPRDLKWIEESEDEDEDEPVHPAADESAWVSFDQARSMTGLDKSELSRLCNGNKIRSKGIRRERKIHAGDLARHMEEVEKRRG